MGIKEDHLDDTLLFGRWSGEAVDVGTLVVGAGLCLIAGITGLVYVVFA